MLNARIDLTFPPGCAYIAGNFVPMAGAKISILDWGLLRSDATYDLAHVWHGRLFRLDTHIARFQAGINKVRLALPFDHDQPHAILAECVRRSKMVTAYVEMILTRGVCPTFSRAPRDAVNAFIAFAIPLGSVANEEQMQRGLDLHISAIPRIQPESIDPTIKNYHWLDLIVGLYEAYDAGSENVLLVDGAGRVTEGAGFNIFAMKDGRAITPDHSVLEGITRRTTLELVGELQIKAKTVPLAIGDLKTADEAFIASTAGGIMPVGRIDGQASAPDLARSRRG